MTEPGQRVQTKPPMLKTTENVEPIPGEAEVGYTSKIVISIVDP